MISCSSGEKIDRLAVFSDLPIANGCDYRHADGTVGKGIAQRISIQSFVSIGQCFDSERVDWKDRDTSVVYCWKWAFEFAHFGMHLPHKFSEFCDSSRGWVGQLGSGYPAQWGEIDLEFGLFNFYQKVGFGHIFFVRKGTRRFHQCGSYGSWVFHIRDYSMIQTPNAYKRV